MGRANRGTASGGQARDYWGSTAQPFWRPGVNPAVDLVVVCEEEVLLIRRGGEPHRGDWALPGGFHDSEAGRGEPWRPGLETASEAALRELREETGVLLDKIEEVGVFEGGGRDPRDNNESWSRSTAFLARLKHKPLAQAGDDAEEARWFSRAELQDLALAFDHKDILAEVGIL